MHLRRSLAVAASAIALATTLSSCGFDYATDRVYTPAAGPIDRDATVDVLSAVIVSKAAGSGTFIAGLSNNSGSEAITFEAIRPVGDTTISFEDFEAREIPRLGFENLSAEGNGILVTGEFEAGNFVGVQLAFDNGETVEMQVPVVTDCDEFDGFDASETDGEEYDCEPLEPVADGRYENYHPEGEHSDEEHAEGSEDGEH
ncbi:MAG: hypothetical protein KJ938_03870 [Actinobacteria bacterium]|jgi:hypothetical protein|nr:hypothetical protein [Actinomycetota bacterium]